MGSISTAQLKAGASLVFAAGDRPAVAEIEQALDACQASAQIGHSDLSEGALEVLVNGLSFDLYGLAPGRAVPSIVLPQDRYGLDASLDLEHAEAIILAPDEHLSGGLRLPPVHRAMIALLAELAVCLPARAVLWHPAHTAMEPRTFSRMALAWLAGGAFPALGLTALSAMSDGSIISRGLAHFIGQEVTVTASADEAQVLSIKRAARIVDTLVRHGPLREVRELVVDGQRYCAEPARRGEHVWVWHQD